MIETWEQIEDPDDPRLTDYLALNNQRRREAVERRGGFFICEGVSVVSRLFGSSLSVRSVVATPEKIGRLTVPGGVPAYVASRDTLASVAGFDFHRGVLASANRPGPVALGALKGPLILLEGINDHENLGAIFRSGFALGAKGAVLDPTAADPFYRRCVRVSMGAVIDIPIARCRRWPDEVEALSMSGAFVVALSPGGVAISSIEVPNGRYPALMVGAEGPGLTAGAMDAADVVAGIPMVSGQDSLNAGHAFAIAAHRLFET